MGLNSGPLSNDTVTWEGNIENQYDAVDGLKIGWSHPPEGLKISISQDGHHWVDATGWLPATRPETHDQGSVVQNVILRKPIRGS